MEKINETDGRNRSEQASYLGRVSQFVHDIDERGANIVDGKLIVPQETRLRFENERYRVYADRLESAASPPERR